MTESVAADDRLVRLHRKTGQLADQAAGPIDLRGIDTRREIVISRRGS